MHATKIVVIDLAHEQNRVRATIVHGIISKSRERGDSNIDAGGRPNFWQEFDRMKSLETLDKLVNLILKYKPRKKTPKPG
jgi:hypothetical protein